MKMTLKLVSAIAGGLIVTAPLVASAQMADPDSVQNEVNVPDGPDVTEPADLPDQANVPDVPDAPDAVEVEAPDTSN